MRPAPILLLSILMTRTAHAEITTFVGTLGDARIGMTIDVADPHGDAPLGPRSHYFYRRHLRDIPLTGRVSSKSSFTEPSGGVFALRFTGNGSEHGETLTLYNSTGLAGTWTRAGKVLPVSLQGDWGGSSRGALYSDVTDVEDAAAFEMRVRAFRRAVLSDDRPAAVRFVRFPLRVNASKGPRSIESAPALLAAWDTVFTPGWRQALIDATPHDMFVHQGEAMIGGGMAWFDGKGLVSVNPPLSRR